MMRKIKIIGLCGTSGSGKGYVCKAFAARGVPSIDTDLVYRQLVDEPGGSPSECLAELCREFGACILDGRGRLSRRELSKIVFAPDGGARLKKLNEISHKYILAETKRIIDEYEKRGAQSVIIDAPVLFESGFDSLCDICVCVSAPTELCVKRIISRDNISEADARRRLANQKSADELRALCNFEIVNDDAADIWAQIDKFCDAYGIFRE